MKNIKITLLLLVFFFFSCDNIFEYTVYEAGVEEEQKNTTAKNLELLENVVNTSSNFKFAFLSDSHYFYDELRAVVEDINKNDEILFVVFGGDITEQALLKEYEIFYNIISNLEKPYLTVIGNHDYNSNGNLIYSRMFGDYNYTFEFANNKFILFDDIVWESKKTPDFAWLETELQNNTSFDNVFVFAHIPPFGDQFTTELKERYEGLMTQYNVPLSLHGHTHSYKYNQGAVSYFTVPSLKEMAYGIVAVENDTFTVELIEL